MSGRAVAAGGDRSDAGLERFAHGPAPRDEPLRYPGAHPRCSFLFTAAGVERLDGVDSGGVEDDALAGRLAALGAAPMSERRAVLAYGSNRSPAQLRSKYAGEGVDATIPVVRAELLGASVVHNAAVARYGSVPAALVDDPAARTEVAVTFLDERELDAMDRSEGRHARIEIDPKEHRVVLAGGRELVGCERYRSSRPVLTWAREPVRLREVASAGSDLPARSQLEIQRLLLPLWAARLAHRPVADEHELVAAVRSDHDVLNEVNQVLRDLVVAPLGELGARFVRELEAP